MTKRMDRGVWDASGLEVLGDQELDAARTDPLAEPGDEDDVILSVRRPHCQVRRQCLTGLPVQPHHAILPTAAADVRSSDGLVPHRQRNIRETQTRKL